MDQAAAGIVFFDRIIQKTEVKGPPKLRLHLLMGLKLKNLQQGLTSGKLMLQSGQFRLL